MAVENVPTNLFSKIPNTLPEEVMEDLVNTSQIRIERILSHGHASPDEGWYEQEEHEWVLVVQGEAVLRYEDETERRLGVGDYVNIPAGVKHRVAWSDPEQVTIWLAVFYR
jgi:cupin 2 domain-containing protein